MISQVDASFGSSVVAPAGSEPGTDATDRRERCATWAGRLTPAGRTPSASRFVVIRSRVWSVRTREPWPMPRAAPRSPPLSVSTQVGASNRPGQWGRASIWAQLGTHVRRQMRAGARRARPCRLWGPTIC